MRRPAGLPLLLLAAALACIPPSAGAAELSKAEQAYVAEYARLAAEVRYCGLDWLPLYRAFLGSWRRTARNEEEVDAAARHFEAEMDVIGRMLSLRPCQQGSRLRLDYQLREAMDQLGP